MTKVAICHVEAALSRLNIHHREFPYSKGKFYLCTIPSYGITFDIIYDENGSFKMWRFVGTSSTDMIGTRQEYRKSNAALGLEVTDEGDVSLYAKCLIDYKDPNAEKRILKIVKGYTEMITQLYSPFHS